MKKVRGIYRSISRPRRWMGDLVALSRTIPIAALEHRLHLKPLMEARAALPKPHISWVALFIKALALVARRRAHLRQGYFRYPWPRLYEHPFSITAVTVEREWDGEPAIFFEMISEPEKMALAELHRLLRCLKTDPVETLPTLNLLSRATGLPKPLRRMLWRYFYSFSGPLRARRIGTFAINGGTRYPIRPVTTTGAIGTTLYFGLFDEEANTDVCLTFDHRVMDGGEVVRALDEMESIMNTDLVLELRAMAVQA